MSASCDEHGRYIFFFSNVQYDDFRFYGRRPWHQGTVPWKLCGHCIGLALALHQSVCSTRVHSGESTPLVVCACTAIAHRNGVLEAEARQEDDSPKHQFVFSTKAQSGGM